MTDPSITGNEIYDFAAELFPICRSLTGPGVRETLERIAAHVPELEVHEIPSGTDVFDWTVPDEWTIRDAYVMDEAGRRVIDFRQNNLHVLGYSVPVDREMTLDELQPHLHSSEDQPDAIPYVTSYYKRRWGFCLTHNEREKLRPGCYRVVIDSDLQPGSLTYGEILLRGREEQEVLLSTYICHPSLANNEVSGPALTTFLAKWIKEQGDLRLSYRIIFVPETIGAIAYLSRNIEAMRRKTAAGFVVTCVGDDRTYSFLPSRLGGTLADRVAEHVLRRRQPNYDQYTYLDRGSDEQQYCSPGVDLPVASIMRSKYGTYPEYHTSLDNMDLISPDGFQGALEVYQDCLRVLEQNAVWRVTTTGVPQLGRRGLYPSLSMKNSSDDSWIVNILNILAYADGDHDLVALADRVGVYALDCVEYLEKLAAADVIERVDRLAAVSPESPFRLYQSA